jgi:hypothetical protein
MFNWTDLSSFEFSVIVGLISIISMGLVMNGKLSYIARLKEIELRKKGIIEMEDD